MHRNQFVVLSLVLVSGILTVKFIGDVFEYPTHPLMIATLFAVLLSFGDLRNLPPDPEIFDDVSKRLFRIAAIGLVICLVANLFFPASGIVTTILTWVIGHAAVVALKGSYTCSVIISRLQKLKP